MSKKMNRSIVLLVVFLLVVFLLVVVGCSNGQNVNSNNGKVESSKSESSKATSSKDSNKKTEVIYWHSKSGVLGDALQMLVDNFNKESNAYVLKPVFQGGYVEMLPKVHTM